MRPAACTARRGGFAGKRFDAGRRILVIEKTRRVARRCPSPSCRPHEDSWRRDVTLRDRRATGEGMRRGERGEDESRRSEAVVGTPAKSARKSAAGPAPGAAGAVAGLLTILRGESAAAAAGAVARRHGTDVTRPRHTHASHSKSPVGRPSRAPVIPPKTTQQTWRRRHRRAEHSRRQARGGRGVVGGCMGGVGGKAGTAPRVRGTPRAFISARRRERTEVRGATLPPGGDSHDGVGLLFRHPAYFRCERGGGSARVAHRFLRATLPSRIDVAPLPR